MLQRFHRSNFLFLGWGDLWKMPLDTPYGQWFALAEDAISDAAIRRLARQGGAVRAPSHVAVRWIRNVLFLDLCQLMAAAFLIAEHCQNASPDIDIDSWHVAEAAKRDPSRRLYRDDIESLPLQSSGDDEWLAADVVLTLPPPYEYPEMRSGTALIECTHYQSNSCLLMRQEPLRRLTEQIAGGFVGWSCPLAIQPSALRALQQLVEDRTVSS